MIHNKAAMLTALKKKKESGLNVHILVGGGDGELGEDGKKEQKELGLAPEGAMPTHEDGAEAAPGPMDDEAQEQSQDDVHDKQLIEEELAKAGLARGGLAHKASLKRKI